MPNLSVILMYVVNMYTNRVLQDYIYFQRQSFGGFSPGFSDRQRSFQHPIGAGMVEQQQQPSPFSGFGDDLRGGGDYGGRGGGGGALGPMFQTTNDNRWM